MKPNAERGPLIGLGRTAEVYAWGDNQILKLYRPETPREWVAHEATIGRIVAEAGLAAPSVGDVVEVEGRLGIIYERISGPSMLDALVRRPWGLLRSARQFAEVHAAMLFGGRPLPEAYDLNTDALLNREAWALIEVVEKDGTIYNRIAQLFPLRALVLADASAPAPLPEADEAPW